VHYYKEVLETINSDNENAHDILSDFLHELFDTLHYDPNNNFVYKLLRVVIVVELEPQSNKICGTSYDLLLSLTCTASSFVNRRSIIKLFYNQHLHDSGIQNNS